MYLVYEDFFSKHNIYDDYEIEFKNYILIHFMAILVSMVKNDSHDKEIEDKILKYVRNNADNYLKKGCDSLMHKISVFVIKYSYPLFRLISKIVVRLR